ncbi:hypothetical protein BV22DRAFT_444637 [Leucogyrophana mollusca]|uniref:Uncharacterized protein n=1 Tax=Leucogyrophana mollusca TaxID=85980 RepID=A0ACB8BHL1_9AGAM|nr:hypothetical protein BV22DRAFT_444637 [Leucogyrophana mollusca]
MAIISPPVATALKIVTTVLQGLAILFTAFRLWYRVRIRRFWWEDTWALMALLCDLVGLASGWVYFSSCASSSVLKCVLCPQATRGQALNVSSLVYSFSFTSVVWSVRMSIILSILRIVYPSSHIRRITYGVATLFAVLWGVLMALKAINWRSTFGSTNTHSVTATIACELASDILADVVLAALPLRLLWSVKLHRKQRRIILTIFSSSLIISMASSFHAACELQHLTSLVSVAKDFELAFCLIVCNLLVVVTFIYRTVKNDDESDSDGSSKSNQSFSTREPTTVYFTTVDFDHLSSHAAASSPSSHRLGPPSALAMFPADENVVNPTKVPPTDALLRAAS